MPSHRFTVLVVSSVACGSKSTDSSMDYGAPTAADCGDTALEVAPGLVVTCDTGDCALQVVETSPAPPDRGDNTWTVQVVDAAGAPVAVTGITGAPFMPAHNHGTSPPDYPGASTDQVDWTVGPFDLFMPGLWELRLTIDRDENEQGQVVVPFCVEG